MSTALATTTPTTEAIEQALIQGNLAVLTPSQRLTYYRQICESLGLNPLTKPFEYITLNGKLTLYARKDCTDQLRRIKGVSIRKPDISFQDDWIVVTVEAVDATGRTDSDIGVVNKRDMRGEFGNAIMKAVTKAKRRVTLSICGLGMMDETEVEAIPAARTFDADEAHGGEVVVQDPRQIPGVKSGADLRDVAAELQAATTLEALGGVWKSLSQSQMVQFLTVKDECKAKLTPSKEGEQSPPKPATTNAQPAGHATASASTPPASTAASPPKSASAPKSDPTSPEALAKLVDKVAAHESYSHLMILDDIAEQYQQPLAYLDEVQRKAVYEDLQRRLKAPQTAGV